MVPVKAHSNNWPSGGLFRMDCRIGRDWHPGSSFNEYTGTARLSPSGDHGGPSASQVHPVGLRRPRNAYS